MTITLPATRRFLFVLGTLTLLAAGCGAGVEPAGTSEKAQADTTALPATGFVPYPVRVDTSGQPLLGIDGKPVAAWDGTLADLLAADAYALCGASFMTSSEEAVAHGSDGYLKYLQGKMQGAICEAADPDPNAPATKTGQWLYQRTQLSQCNVDTSTMDATVLTDASGDPGDNRYEIPIDTSIPFTANDDYELFSDAIGETTRELEVARLDLCMAVRLRAKLTSADVLVASGRDQLELLEVIRQRAQIAMHYFALVGLAISNTDSHADAVTNAKQILPVLRAWAKTPGTEDRFRALGQDFAQAVQLHIDTTTELAQLLWRRASANADDSDLTMVSRTNATAADRAWGPGAWRNRLDNLLWGGDPLGAGFDPNTPQSFNHDWGFYGGWGTKPYVKEDVNSPEVDELLGLARAADSIYLPSSGDPGETADYIYRDVDAYLHQLDCLKQTPTAACNFDVSSAEVPPLSQYEDSLLWQRFKITPDHATSLARMLIQGAPTRGALGSSPTTSDLHGAVHLVGENGSVTAPPGVTGSNEVWYHVDPQFVAVPLDNATLAPGFGGLVGVAIPAQPYLYAPGTVQGFVARVQTGSMPGSGNLLLRYTGAVSELAAVREAVLQGAAWASSASATAYFEMAKPIADAITAAIGESSAVVRPTRSVVTVNANGNGCLEWGSPAPSSCQALVQDTASGNLGVQVSVIVPASTPSTTLIALHTGGDAFEAGVETTASLAKPFSSFGGFTHDDLDATTGITPADTTTFSTGFERRTYDISWPATVNNPPTRVQYPTLILRFAPDTNGETKYLNLGDSVAFRSLRTAETIQSTGDPVWRSSDGKYLAYGGSLGDIAQRSRALVHDNWSEPANDGFGIPRGWVPPSSPELIGANAGETAVEYYLRTARTASQDATAAVSSAVDALVSQEADAQVLKAAAEKAQTVPTLEREAVCGQGNASCDQPPKNVNIPDPGSGGVICLAPAEWCLAASVVYYKSMPGSVTVSAPVADASDQKGAPTFPQYDGGSIQSSLIAEWTALRAVLDYVKSYKGQVLAYATKVGAAQAQLDAARASTDQAVQSVAFECDPKTFRKALEAGYSFGHGPIIRVTDANTGDDGYVQGLQSVWDKSENDWNDNSWNGSSVFAQGEACVHAREALPTAQATESAETAAAAATSQEAFAWLASQASQTDQLLGALANARSKTGSDVLSGNRAAKIAELDGALQTAGRTTTFGTYRRFHSYDMWRARALLENARRLSATARRAIESRYVVDLSTLTQDEPFVSAPATWADEVYDFDLDAPAAVGLSNSPGKTGGIYPNKLVDYVGNLENFVEGYSIARPTTVAQSDSEVVTLPGPDVFKDVDTTVDGVPTTIQVLDPSGASWMFHCPDTDTWVPHPSTGVVPAVEHAADACGTGATPPDHARLVFRLDPWGRLDGLAEDPPYTARHNARWKRFAVNLVGTGIRDCTLAQDPGTCYAEGFTRYDLQLVGPSWVTNFNQEWRWLAPGIARVEGGKAIAAEEWLDPLVNGWEKPFVDQAARTELTGLPLGASYVLDLALTPDMRLDRVERIQLLTETEYWVSQGS